MKTLLVPTDFSPAGRNATDYAAALARHFSAKLVLFHAYMVPTPVSEVPYAMATVEDLQQQHEADIRKEANYLFEKYGIQAEWLVRIGVASDEVRELCREKNADLVIMGMKGAGGLEKIIGSTTISIIRKLHTPVLVVPGDARYSPITDIVYASDFSYNTSVQLFRPLLAIAKQYGAKIHILNITKSPEKMADVEIAGKQHTEHIFEGLDHDYVAIISDHVTKSISDYVHQKPAQLLAMVAHKHTFFERIFSRDHTKAMAYDTHIPLLILQGK
jgi:Universal stress protein UspA and related nucleotide-binding proteins